MRYRIALCGFGEFEYRAMHFSFQHPASARAIGYDVVDALADADFSVVDADSKPAVKGVVLSGRVPHAVFVGAVAPEGARLHVPRPIDPTRILRLLDELATLFPRIRTSGPSVRLEPPPGEHPLPTLDDVVAEPGAAIPPAAAVPAPAAHHDSPAKTAARAAARRARLASKPADPAAAEPLRDVMVLDGDEAAAAPLCTVLERFGFNAYAVRSIAQAGELLAKRQFAAFFLDIALDDAGHGESLALLERIRELPVPEGHPAPAVLMVAAQLHPSDRVRAALAGLPAPLMKPLSRGDVARALEGFGVPLPSDARRV